MTASHPDDVKLAALLDRALPEHEAAEARGHVARCPPCHERVHALETLLADLGSEAAPDERQVQRILEKLDAARPRHAWALVLPLAAAAAAALLVIPRAMPPDELVARGAPVDVAPVHLKVFHVVDGVLSPGTSMVPGAPVTLSVVLDVMPGQGATHAAVYARDASGHITWLLPSWTDATASPACVALPAGGGPVQAAHAVELPRPVTAPVEIVALTSTRRCELRQLDDTLESGGDVTSGDVRVASRVILTPTAR